ncbi:MAG: hypothetical protein WEB58_17720 [Planctomycetaceae bacterium]
MAKRFEWMLMVVMIGVDMSDHIQKTVDEVRVQIDQLTKDLAHKKRMVNDLLALAGQPPCYVDIESSSHTSSSIRPDQFYGQPLAKVARKILEINHRAMAVSAIYDAMVTGGYDFNTATAENAKRALRISLSKNTSTFHKLPNATVGLLEWYPNIKASGKSKPDDNRENGNESDDVEVTEFHEDMSRDEESIAEEAKAVKG